MSHIVKRKAAFKVATPLIAAVKRMSGEVLDTRPDPLRVEYLRFSLPGFYYPLIWQNTSTDLVLDSDDLHGTENEKHLGQLAQYYVVEAGRLEANSRGYSFEEIPMTDGGIKCVIEVPEQLEASLNLS